MAAPDYLFVYGTLRYDAGHHLHQLIRENARDLGPATFAGRLYDFGAYPGVVDADASSAARVHGELYEIVTHSQLVFERLDAYEECGPGFAEPTEYVRERRPVRLAADGADYSAWIYLYNHSLAGAQFVPGGDYIKR